MLMDLSAGLIDGVAKLAQLGGIGVGMAVFLFAFFLAWKGQPVDSALAAYRMRALTLGAVFALLALLISLAQFALGNTAAAATGRMTVTYSPSFAAENLPTPAMQLIGGSSGTVVPDEPFTVAPGTTLKITADQLIQQAQNVKQLAATAQNAVASNVQLTAALTAASPGPALPPVAVAPGAHPGPTPAAIAPAASSRAIAPSELLKLHAAQTDILANLQRGNYAAAAVTSNRFSQVRIGGQTYAVGQPQP